METRLLQRFPFPKRFAEVHKENSFLLLCCLTLRNFVSLHLFALGAACLKLSYPLMPCLLGSWDLNPLMPAAPRGQGRGPTGCPPAQTP